jgi:hypothetical protein
MDTLPRELLDKIITYVCKCPVSDCSPAHIQCLECYVYEQFDVFRTARGHRLQILKLRLVCRAFRDAKPVNDVWAKVVEKKTKYYPLGPITVWRGGAGVQN